MAVALALTLVAWWLQLCGASPGITSGRAADFYVAHIPDLAPGVRIPEMHAGLLEVGTQLGLNASSLFFWHIRATQDSQTTIIWLNGGPGCSSMDGNFLEIGPFQLGRAASGQDERLLYGAEGSWAEVANLLFVDQPFGTGFSDPDTEELLSSVEDTARAFVVFLREYAKVFPEIADTQIVLAGESFAGQYIPHIWHALEQDAEARASIKGVQAVLLGNPWVDPPNQYLSVPEFARKHEMLEPKYYDELGELQDQCAADLQSHAEAKGEDTFQTASCELLLDYVNQHSFHNDRKKCHNVYNIALPSTYPQCGLEWPEGLDRLKAYLSRRDVREALHAAIPDAPWTECSRKVHRKLTSGRSGKDYFAKIMEQVPLMLMIGDNDFICNSIGQDRFVANLRWNGEVGFTDASATVETEYGTWRSERNLTMVHVANASHMVPVDDLDLSKELIMKLARIAMPKEGGATPSLPPGVADPASPSQEDINRAMYRAYGQASIVALVIVVLVCLILGAIWWRRGQCPSGKGLFNALLHLPTRIKPSKSGRDYIPLASFGRGGSPSLARHRPEVIIEEDEEGLEA